MEPTARKVLCMLGFGLAEPQAFAAVCRYGGGLRLLGAFFARVQLGRIHPSRKVVIQRSAVCGMSG